MLRTGIVALALLSLFGKADAMKAASPSSLEEAVAAGDHEAAGEAARSVISGDPGKGAGILCEGIVAASRTHESHLAVYCSALEKLKKIHVASEEAGTDPGRKGEAEFDGIFPDWMTASFGLEDSERCALAIAKAFEGVGSEDALKTVVREIKKAPKMKLGDYLVEALANLSHDGVEAELIRIVKGRSATWRMKVAALDGLGSRKSETSREVIWANMTSLDGRLRRAAHLANAAHSGEKADLDGGSGNSGATFYQMQVDCESGVFVVDCSDSMQRSDAKSRDGTTKPRFDVLKEELTAVVRDLPDGINMNVVGFNSLAWVLDPKMFVLDKQSRPLLMKYIEEMAMAWQTAATDGLQVGFLLANGDLAGSNDVITGKGDGKAVDTIFFMTDGAPALHKRFGEELENKKENTDLILGRVRLWNRRHRIRINTIQLGTKGGKGGWLSEMAGEHRGEYASR